MHIQCTQGTPIVETLDHLPPLPLFVHYKLDGDFVDDDVNTHWKWVPLSGEDELGLYRALRLPDRVHRIELLLLPSTLHKSIMLMDEPFPILERLSLLVVGYEITTLTLPTTFLAPELRHLTLRDVGLPKRLRLLTSAISLGTLTLWNIPASGYFRPRLLVARLQSLPQLEELSIGFAIPLPRPSAERELLGKQGTPVTLSKLKSFSFQGVSAYMERLVSQMRAPLLDQLNVTLFNQIAFTLPHLTHFVNIAEQIKFHTVTVSFKRDAVSIASAHRHTPFDGQFVLSVRCKPLDWQIDCMAQICSALIPTLSGVKNLALRLEGSAIPTEWQIDGTTWRELLRSFIGVKELSMSHRLEEELSCALEVDDIATDPGLLPDLRELVLVGGYGKTHADSLFGSFMSARQAAGRPISLHLRPQYPHY